MELWRTLQHNLHRFATQPSRHRLRSKFASTLTWPAAVLFYHRVADFHPNPWTIENKRFADHLDFVTKVADFASLDDIIDQQKSGQRNCLKVAITFDDGYRDNLDWAIPELLRRKIPVTYFVTTDNVETGLAFPHDLLRKQPLAVHTKSEITELAAAGVQIGGHTASHLNLGREWPLSILRRELVDSRKKLQDWTGQAIDHFAFPFGLENNMSQSAIYVLVEAGYRSFSSAYGGWNFPGGDAFHLHRFHGDPCSAALRNWLTFDPRKLDQPTFEYRLPPAVDDSERLPSLPTSIDSESMCAACH